MPVKPLITTAIVAIMLPLSDVYHQECLQMATCQVSLSGADPYLPAPTTGVEDENEWGDDVTVIPAAAASWDFDLTMGPPF